MEQLTILPPVNEQKPSKRKKFPKEAYFTGGNNYSNPNDHFPYGGHRFEGPVQVVEEKPGTKHPYKVKPVGSTIVSGWVDKDTLVFKEEK